MNRNISKASLFALLLPLTLVAMTGCTKEGNATVADKDELASYLEAHPELVEDSKKLEAQWEDGYVEPDGEADQK